ncbi:hypothetical protein C4803_15580 [Salmonella enterica subsp. arizonae serovar 51:g,z51:-]|nr:hypothetical protein C4803_15580 [Salmonella enterica subsp. arizonae serovar 51:g,z51:-]
MFLVINALKIVLFSLFLFIKLPFSRTHSAPFLDLLAKLSPDRVSYCKIPFPLSYYQIFAIERLPFS